MTLVRFLLCLLIAMPASVQARAEAAAGRAEAVSDVVFAVAAAEKVSAGAVAISARPPGVAAGGAAVMRRPLPDHRPAAPRPGDLHEWIEGAP